MLDTATKISQNSLTAQKFPLSNTTVLIFEENYNKNTICNKCFISLPKLQKLLLHSSKKVTQHDFDRLYFYYLGFLFIKLDIPRKLDYLPFH